MNAFSQYASAFNCGLITFKKHDMGGVPPAWFPMHIAGDSCLYVSRKSFTEEDRILIKYFKY